MGMKNIFIIIVSLIDFYIIKLEIINTVYIYISDYLYIQLKTRKNPTTVCFYDIQYPMRDYGSDLFLFFVTSYYHERVFYQ